MKLTSPSAAEAVVAVTGLSRRFGNKTALATVSVYIPRGSVLGLVGENGAGKTTLIRHLLGMLKAQAGSVRVFGLDPVTDPVGVLSRVGHLSERRDLPGWTRVDEFMRHTQAFYPEWDEQYARELLEQFQLDPAQKISSQSQGQQAKTGLLTALAYCSELLILDEPSSGLDPVVRRDILEAIIRVVADEGRTVLFSSHLLEEVERVADQVVMLQRGRVALNGRTLEVRRNHISALLAFGEPQSVPPELAGAHAVVGHGSECRVLFGGSRLDLEQAATKIGARVIEERTPSLDEILVARARGGLDAERMAVGRHAWRTVTGALLWEIWGRHK
jgi:ABC-2 type transport system ATP-binding protein